MIELATLARPYSEAVFKRATETQTAEEWSDTLAFLSGVMDDEQISLAAQNPRVEREGFVRVLFSICEGQISDEGRNFVKLLIQNNRLSLIRQIGRLYEELRAENEGYIEVDIRTAFSLSKADRQHLSDSLEKSLHKNVRLHVEVDKSLIGGVLIRAGDKVIDGTIRGRLDQLSKRLSS